VITVAQANKYLNITGTTQNAFMGDCINKAKSHIETYLNWENLSDTEYTKYYKDIEGSEIALAMALTSVGTLQYLDSDKTATDIIDGTTDGEDDTIANSTLIDSPLFRLFKGYSFTGYFLKIVFNAGYKFTGLTGTVTTAIGSATVTGVGTLFTTELSAGDYIIVGNEKKQVSSVTDITHLETTDTFYSVNTGVAITLTTLPDIFRQKLEETTAYTFRESYQGQSTLMLESKSSSGSGLTDSENYKPLDLTPLDKYKNLW